MVEVRVISFKTKEVRNFLEPMLQLHDYLKGKGFIDIHENILTQSSEFLNSILEMDLKNIKSIRESLNLHSPRLLINKEKKEAILINTRNVRYIDEKTSRLRFTSMIEIVCFSETKKMNELYTSLKRILMEEMENITDVKEGDISEIEKMKIIESSIDTHRSKLIQEITDEGIEIFFDKNIRDSLKSFTNFEVRVFPSFILGTELGDLNKLVSVNILKESFTPICKKCGEKVYEVTPYVSSFNSKEAVFKILEEEVMLCPVCGRKLDSKSASIEILYGFTELGLECARGLWLEAYIRSILKKAGMSEIRMRSCVYHRKDELDHIFIDSGNLIVCECKDRIIGQNDVHILNVKVTRINANKIFLISTEPISKDILPSNEGEGPVYIPISGEAKAIAKGLQKELGSLRNEYKMKKIDEVINLFKSIIPEETRIWRTYSVEGRLRSIVSRPDI